VLAVAIASFGATLVVGQGAVIGATFVAGSALILFQVSSEEIFFRGCCSGRSKGAPARAPPFAFQTLVFAGFHLLGGTRSALTLANLLLGGIWFGLLAWRSGGLVASLLAHFSWNATEELIAGLSPNPGTGQFGALVDLDLMGKPLWGGSEEGLNASVAMSIVLVALILPLVLQRTAASAPFGSGPRSNGPLS
jgi:membrane protease YdiL (CAAX protease family)